MTRTDKITELRRKAMALPLQPGVYLMKDETGHIIYIGKAKKLKNRVSQYFGSDTNHSEKVRQMVSRVDTFDYIVVGSEFEALVLECSLIKQHTPKYNILLKDDKGYHYIRVSPPPYSRLSEAKQTTEDGARYIGPYMSSYAIKQAVDEANKIYSLATCSRPLAYGKKGGERPCLNHYIGQCCAPCTGKVDPDAYQERVDEAVEFLTRGSAKTLAILQQRMEEAADRLDFEQAARLRDRIAAIKRLSEKQKVVLSRIEEQDVIALAQGSGKACFEVFRFTDGQLSDREQFLMEEQDELPSARAAFIQQYYTLRGRIPPQVTVDGEVEDRDLLEQWLTDKAKRRIHIVLPQIGEQAKLTEMCRQNAAERIAQQVGMTGQTATALEEIRQLLDLPNAPTYIECYDISHTAGSEPVAAMVVFENGQPLRSAYRKFRVKSAIGGDDYGAMAEVLTRRIEEYLANRDSGVGFGRKPDLILLDGGSGQVAAVAPVLQKYALDIPLYGLVKDDRHRTRAIALSGGEIAIHRKRAAFTLLANIQEEVHRSAIRYHRQRRKGSSLATTLTEIEGIGPTRAKALLRQFGSLKGVQNATIEELLLVKGMTRPAAESIQRYFQSKG
ncbi:MAG: excinuclease ABC subunit UvrC [Clostridia bacterium]|nr:excinuclease ABC subunit UvrC [Clostridia bacterium]